MMLADSNVWLALTLSQHRFHEASAAWMQSLPKKPALLFCRATQQSFLRLLTTRAVMEPYGIPPLSNHKAWSVYEGFRADRRVGWADEPEGLDDRWKAAAGHAKPSPKLWMDAYLAAFAIQSGHQLVTTDRDFRQFKGLDLFLLGGD